MVVSAVVLRGLQAVMAVERSPTAPAALARVGRYTTVDEYATCYTRHAMSMKMAKKASISGAVGVNVYTVTTMASRRHVECHRR